MGLVRADMEDALLQASVRKKADDALRAEVEFRKRKSGDIAGAMDLDRADVSCAKMKRFCPVLKSDRPTNRKKAGIPPPPAAGDAKKSGTESSAEWSLLEESAEGSTRAPSFSVSTGRFSKSSSVSESEGQGANWKESYSSADDENSDGWTKGGGTTGVSFTDYSRVPWPSEERGGAVGAGQVGGFLCEGRRRRGSSVAAMGFPWGGKAVGGSGPRPNETDCEGNFGLFRRVAKDGHPCLKRLTNDSGARGSTQGADHNKERRERGVPAENVNVQVRRKDGQSEESGDGRGESLANRSQSDDSGEVRAKISSFSRRQNDGAARLRWKDVQASTVSTGEITDGRSDEQRTTGASGRADARDDPGGGAGQLCWGLSTVKRGRSESEDCTSSELQESRSDSRANEVTSAAKDDKRPRDWRALGSGIGGAEEGANFSFRGLLSSEDKGNDLQQQVGSSTITEEGESDAKSGEGAANTESTGPVKFVLSSGRKTAYGDRDADGDARMGKKELTIDEEFELHFSQMFI
ncbi:hypothetical protein CBR_g11910 [Chara braunii]|uniref:Uncharacterized protein n=1 Tax=Chara braunii TaxID=69332 RepID=A0A388KQI4_CHABU|nr:hypothetical protein CBR_g11910 [Chara braunii]|eukprot:GBG72331.1 hypothetical protein CBR_g11910 [Chara braunii]